MGFLRLAKAKTFLRGCFFFYSNFEGWQQVLHLRVVQGGHLNHFRGWFSAGSVSVKGENDLLFRLLGGMWQIPVFPVKKWRFTQAQLVWLVSSTRPSWRFTEETLCWANVVCGFWAKTSSFIYANSIRFPHLFCVTSEGTFVTVVLPCRILILDH